MASESETDQVLKAVTADGSDYNVCSKSTGSDSALNPMHSATRVLCPELDGTDTILARKIPYSVGVTTIATCHEPHEPFGLGYSTECPPVSEDWKGLSQLDYCLSNLWIGGTMQYQDTKALKITAVIRAGYNQGAQLVVVNDNMVAKIYDPLFYEQSIWCHFGEDVVSNANSDYCREAAAYYQLQKSPAAQEFMPAFYGTWMLPIHTLRREGDQLWKYTRQVPAILIEYVGGTTMTDIDPRVLSERMRTNILKKVLHSESVIYHAGVLHRDITPRNIIIGDFGSDAEHDAPKEVIVKVVDFNVAHIRLHPNHADEIDWRMEKKMQAWYPKLPSPFVRNWSSMDDFSQQGWCPRDDLESDDHASSLWLWRQFKDDERYIPVIWDPANPDELPREVKSEIDSLDSSDSDSDTVVKSSDSGSDIVVKSSDSENDTVVNSSDSDGDKVDVGKTLKRRWSE